MVGVLADGEWWNAVWNTLKFAVISVTLETLLGWDRRPDTQHALQGRGLVRAAVLIPSGDTDHHRPRCGLDAARPVRHSQSPPARDRPDFRAPGLDGKPRSALTAVILVDVWKTTPVHDAVDPGRLADVAYRLL